MDFRVLGPLEVDAGDGALPLGGPKQRAVLANLLVRGNEVVPTDTLIMDVWGELPPSKARNTLQTYVSNLRKTLGEGRLQGRPPGYVLVLDPSELDATRFEGILRNAKRSLTIDPSVAIASIDDALSLWRGPALADLADQQALYAQAARLDDLRLSAQEIRIEALIASGASARAAAELEPLLATQPLRESLWGLMMLALYREGRQADALDAYRNAREMLASELGIDPSPELQKMHARLLEHDPSLELRGSGLRGYRLLEKLGESRDGVVFRGIQPRVERDVAIKVFDERVASDPEFTQRFEVEAQAAAALEHANLVPIYDYWREPGRAYIVSRFLRGGSLQSLLERRDSLGNKEASSLIVRLASALACVHRQGFGHGNVGAASVLLDLEGTAYLGEPRIGVGPPASAEEDVRALSDLVCRLFGDPPLALRELVDRVDSGESVSAGAFVDAASSVLEPARSIVHEEVRNPYKGLRPFAEVDAQDFFGRIELTGQLLAALTMHGGSSGFLGLVGPSGCGKSSLLRAGLLPALRKELQAEGRAVYIAEMFPGVHPMDELEAALLRMAVRPVSNLRDRLEAGSRGLLEAADALVPEGSDLVLVVDQLEELFTLTTDVSERMAFLELVRVTSVDPDSRFRIVVTLRADFYDRPLLQPRFGELLAARTQAISPLTPDELEQAICGPAQRAGLSLEPGLVAELIAEVAHQPGSLPLLQYALTELVECRERDVLTLGAYREIGGVTRAVSSRAERIFRSSNQSERMAIRQVFLRLVTLGEGREDTRRRVTRTELDGLEAEPGTLDQVLGAFGHHRIVTFDREPLTREPTVEIAHEALLRGWDRLRRWIDTAREDLRTESWLSRAAAEWRVADHDLSFLLRGARLDQTEAWGSTTDLIIGRPELAYLKASVDRREFELQQEQLRRAHELTVEQRSIRRTRALVVVFAVAALVAGLLTLVATGQSGRASTEARIAHARELAAAAEANLDSDPERSILLAVAAVNQTRAVDGSVLPEAEAALHSAITASRALMTLPGVGGNVAWGDKFFATEDSARPSTIDIRDRLTGRVLRSISMPSDQLVDMEFSSDGALLLSSSSGGLLQVWNPETAGLMTTVRGNGWTTGISTSGRYAAASWPDEKTVRVVDVASGDVVRQLHDVRADSTALSPDGRAIALGTQSTTVVDLESRHVEFGPLEQTFGAGGVDWSPDGRYLSTLGIAGPDIWNAATGQHLYSLPDSPWVTESVWSVDSSRLVTGGSEARVTVWEIGRNGPLEVLRLTSSETALGVDDLALSPAGTHLIASSLAEDVAKVWDLGAQGDAEWVNIPTVHAFGDVAFMPDSARVLAADPHGRLLTWDVASGRPTGAAIGPLLDEHAFDLSSDGRWISGLGSTATVWNTSSGRAVSDVELSSELDGTNFSPDGELLAVNDAVAGHGTTIINRLGRTIAMLPDRRGFTTWSSKFSPDGRLVATIGEEQDSVSLITIWDWEQQEIVRMIQVPHADGLAFDPEGDRLATAWGTLSMWNVATGSEALTLLGDQRVVTDVAFSPDGSRLAAAASDRTIAVFDASSGELDYSLAASRATPIGRIAFSPDGAKLASQGPLQGSVRVWALDIDDLLRLADQNVTRSFTSRECSQYLHLDQCPSSSMSE